MNNVLDDVTCYSPLHHARMRDGNWWNPILIRSCHPRYKISPVDGCPDKDPSVLELSACVCVRACAPSFLHTQRGFELLPVNYCKALIPLYGRETDITHVMFDTSNNTTTTTRRLLCADTLHALSQACWQLLLYSKTPRHTVIQISVLHWHQNITIT